MSHVKITDLSLAQGHLSNLSPAEMSRVRGGLTVAPGEPTGCPWPGMEKEWSELQDLMRKAAEVFGHLPVFPGSPDPAA